MEGVDNGKVSLYAKSFVVAVCFGSDDDLLFSCSSADDSSSNILFRMSYEIGGMLADGFEFGLALNIDPALFGGVSLEIKLLTSTLNSYGSSDCFTDVLFEPVMSLKLKENV